jgi:class 3 adenylate cyclase/tetratricopeptide (TPR) repeat protein
MSHLSAPPTESLTGSYVPDLVGRWSPDDPPYREVGGSLVSADISGFTALSERLAGYGREGAEELTVLLNQCFGGMIEIIDEFGGDVLKFGGDALLVLFTGDEHTARAAAACFRMRRLIERTWSTPLVKRVKLGISQGIHSGTFNLHLVDAGHRELLVVGPGMSSTVDCEGAAERGQILLSHDAAALLDDVFLGEITSEGRVLDRDPTVSTRRPDEVAGAAGPVGAFVPEWLVEQAAAGRVAEHRVVTVGFVFFGGADSLLLEQGPERLHERLQALATVTEEATSRHGVYWLASDVYAGGGKIILAAGAPRSTGQDEDAAVRTAREILDADVGLPIRAGLNRGPVFMGDLGSDRRRTFTVMGDTVNLAARLMQKSGTGQLVASQAVLDQVPTAFELEELEPFLVKGKTEPIHASLIGAQQGHDHAGESPLATDHDVSFVGREAELLTLRELLETARTGVGRVIDLSGEPGIGKTRLMAELVRGDDDLTVLRASGGLYSRGTPYFAVSTMLRQHAAIDRSANAVVAGRLMSAWVLDRAPEFEPWLPLIAIAFNADVPMTPAVDRIAPANRAARLREVVVDLLTITLTGPTVIIVDDAHRLDEASEELFAALSRRIARRPWLLAALRRIDGESFAVGAEDSVSLLLGALSEEEIRALAFAALDRGLVADEDQVDSLVERGVTNPLFLLELIRSGLGEGAATPDSIEALVTARIDTLGAADRLLLREAAVLGTLVDVNLLADATGQTQLRFPERWERLSGFLVRGSDGRLRFEQGLYREVAYSGLSYRRRRQIHSDVGYVLERRAGENWEESSELLSLHFHHAAVWKRSWRYSVIAGDRARSKYAHAEAADFYRRALESPRSHWPAEDSVSAVAESLADALELNGRYDEADRALTLARRYRNDRESMVRLLRKEGVIRERQGRYSLALRWYGRGLNAITGFTDATRALREEGDLAIASAGVKFRQGRLWESIHWAHRAEAVAKELDDPRMLAHSAYLLMTVYGVLRRPEVADYRDVALPLFEQLGDWTYQGNALNNLGVDAKEAGRWSEALELYERSLAARKEAGDAVGAAFTTHNIGEIRSDQGYLDEAEELFKTAQRSWSRAGYAMGIALGASYLGRLNARRGDFDAARTLLEDGLRRFEAMRSSHFVLETRVFQLECEVLAGNGRGAVAASGPIFDMAKEVGDPLLEAMLIRSKAWAHLQEREYDEAEASANRCIEIGEEIQATYEVALALILRGQVMAATGRDRKPDHSRARALLEELGVVKLPSIAGT